MRSPFKSARAALALVPLGVVLFLPTAGVAQAPAPVADLRADVNRDGVVAAEDRSDEAGEAGWDGSRGAILLPNLDDDWRTTAQRCKTRDGDGRLLPDKALAACNDARNGFVDGKGDAADLAPLRVAAWPGAPEGAGATVTVDEGSREKVRLFVRRDGRFVALAEGGRLSLAELRRGVELGAEARDVVRDPRAWDGYVNVRLTVSAGLNQVSDQVRMRVAPVVFQHDLMDTKRLMYAPTGAADGLDGAARSAPLAQRAAGSEEALTEQLQRIAPEASPEITNEGPAGGEATTPSPAAAEDPFEEWMRLSAQGEADFARDLREAVAEAGTEEGLQRLEDANGDIWAQDYFEPAYASMPAPEGRHQVVRIMVRSANAWPTRNGGVRPRPAGKTVYTELRGPDVGAVQQFDAEWARENGEQDTYNSTGNWGAVPPYEAGGRSFPNGRLLYGSAPGNRPDPSFVRMMRAQGAQPPVVMDTSWLLVGHVDEFLSFLPADNERGWVLAVADPRGALAVLREAQRAGYGEAKMLEGLKGLEFEELPGGDFDVGVVPAERTVEDVLGSREVTSANRRSAEVIDRNLAILRRELGLTEEEIVRVPVLFEPLDFGGEQKMVALLPDAVNGVHLSGGTFLAARQHGPVVEGRDVMEAAVEEALGGAGMEVRWIEDYYFAHVGGGEVHCTTNALRDLSEASPWWSREPEVRTG